MAVRPDSSAPLLVSRFGHPTEVRSSQVGGKKEIGENADLGPGQPEHAEHERHPGEHECHVSPPRRGRQNAHTDDDKGERDGQP